MPPRDLPLHREAARLGHRVLFRHSQTHGLPGRRSAGLRTPTEKQDCRSAGSVEGLMGDHESYSHLEKGGVTRDGRTSE
jgi:hypothetical protein